MTCKERILSNDYADGVVDFPVERFFNSESDACVIPLDDRYSVVYQNRNSTPDLSESVYQYPYVPHLYGLMQQGPAAGPGTAAGQGATGPGVAPGQGTTGGVGNGSPGVLPGGGAFDPTFLEESGIRQLQRPPLNLTGRGCIVAIIDTGIDYRNPAFLDELENSRILAIWDQTDQTGNPPEGYFFGSEYTRENLNEALNGENPLEIVPVRDELLHGTVMAGVAAGSSVDGGRTYLGAAPEADIVIVKLKESKQYLRDFYFVPEGAVAYEETDIMLGVKYADSFGQSFQRPIVICLGIGTNMGDHAGNSLLSGYLNRIAEKRSRVVVVCGGNEGNTGHHYQGSFYLADQGNAGGDSPGGGGRSQVQDVEIRVGENERGIWLEFWGKQPESFQIAVRSPGGESIPPIQLGLGRTDTYRFVFERTVITVQSVLVEPGGGEELIVFRMEAPTPGIWTFRVSLVGQSSSGNFHMWLPIQAFQSGGTYFLRPDPDITLTEPSMAQGVITVSNYNYQNNSFYLESGRGYSRSGQIKPDFAAPGVNIPTLYGVRSGSSLAAAVTAGGAAQFLQWAVVERNSPLANSREVKNYLIKGAVRMPDVEYPNREWGYGRLNVLGAFEVLRGG